VTEEAAKVVAKPHMLKRATADEQLERPIDVWIHGGPVARLDGVVGEGGHIELGHTTNDGAT